VLDTKRIVGAAVALAVLGSIFIAACETTQRSGATEVSSLNASAPFGNAKDVAYAESLWRSQLANYESWSPYPGYEGWQPGNSPHGKVLRYYINDVAKRNSDRPGYGSIIVKENYSQERQDALVAVTVMQKIKGYDPENGDWFWIKYGPNGEVLKNPKGMKLAGRVAKGANQGCIACHSNAGGGDFLFVNDY